MNERSVFLAALEIDDPNRRAAYLMEMCGDDAELRRSVDELLQASVQAGSFMDAPAVTIGASALETAADDDVSLAFLTPSEWPGSLGRLGPYEILELLGHGGFGVVLKARDSKLDRIVAIKTLAQFLASSPAARQRFVREAKAAAAVNHENVVGIYAVSDEGPVPYLVMECVVGVSLEERLRQVGMLELKEIVRIGMQIASGLAAAHKQGLVHRDIKPANVLLENGVERVKITDFGLARAGNDAAITRTGEVAGTPQYMSPEQALGHSLDARSDLFSLGSALYAMCTGHSPFRAESAVAALRRVCDDTPRPILEANPDIPDWLIAIISRLLAKRPEERFQSAKEVAELLGQRLAELQHPAPVGEVSNLPSVSAGQVCNLRPAIQAGSKKAPRPHRWAFSGAVVFGLLVAVGLSEATGVTRLAATVIRIMTPDGTLVIEVDDPQVQVTIEGDGGLSIAGAGPREVRLRPGSYRVAASKDGKVVKTLPVTIARAGKQIVRVTLDRQEPSAEVRVSAAVPALLTPTEGDVLSNGAVGSDVEYTWAFTWTPVAKATGYQLYVIGTSVNGRPMRPLIDEFITTPSHRHEFRNSYATQFDGWHWKVRALVDDQWTAWSPERTFEVAVPQGWQPRRSGPQSWFFVFSGDKAATARGAYATLAKAVLKASTGDTIEIRASGLFVTPPVNLGDKAIVIRAGDGYAPVLRLQRDEAAPRGIALLETTGSLVLEGLDLQLIGIDARNDVRCLNCLGAGRAYIANCRFLANPHAKSIFATHNARIEIRNSQATSALIESHAARFHAQNNVLASPQAVLEITDGSLQLAGNTLVGRRLFMILDDIAGDDPAELAQRLRCEMVENVLDAHGVVLTYAPWSGPRGHPQGQTLPPSDVLLAALQRRVAWRDSHNVFPAEVSLLGLFINPSTTIATTTLADWRQFWRAAEETGNIQGSYRFAGGDVLFKAADAPEQLRPQDFRLSEGSTGYRAGPDGKDLGADIDFVGPGGAYARWKKTPEYQQWLKDTGQQK